MTDRAETTHGHVQGRERRGIRVFSGIPFARAERFRPPQPPAAWAGVRAATETGPPSPQPAPEGVLGRFLPGGRSSEDCLSLNVWTPGVDAARRPVMVWIHGGGFVMGAGSTRIYSGRRIARRGDVVVVTINYRLGALGFLQMGDVPGPEGAFGSNLGVRDQIAALEWVRDNIAAFGGDPGNVTIFGESAGAMSVGTLLGAPSARGLFHRAILQSGAAHNVSTRDQAAKVAHTFLGELGLGPDRSVRLHDIPIDKLLRAQMRTSAKLGIVLGALPWQPAEDADVLPEAVLDAVADGSSAHVPVLLGTNRDEWKLFMLGDRKARAMDEPMLRRRFERGLEGKDSAGRAWSERAFDAYSAGRSGRRAAPRERWIDFQADRIFHWPARRLAEALAGAPDAAPVYAYQLSWSPRLLRERIGACHAIEIPLVFGTWRKPLLRPYYGSGAGVRELSRGIQQAWTMFARHGDPGGGDLPDWPRFDAQARQAIELARHPRLTELSGGHAPDFWTAFES